MNRAEEEVLVKIGKRSGPYTSAILDALDCDVARGLVASGLATCGPFDDWFNLTDRGLQLAQRIYRSQS